jgi:uncharacterized cupin superfamily protein
MLVSRSLEEAAMSLPERPPFIAHMTAGLAPLKDGGNPDMGGQGSPIGKAQGLSKIGIHYEIQPPGSRSSFPHAESEEDEFVLVLKGRPDVWIDGVLYPLEAGDSVAFPAGTGIAHSFLNNADEDMHLIVIGEANKDTNRINYPLEPRRNAIFARKGRYWSDAPQRPLGPHDGKAVAGSRAAGPVDRSGRPKFITHFSDALFPVTNSTYSNLGGQHAALGSDGGLTRLGVHHVVLPPGNRTSNPHAESLEDEFILVLDGKPDVWVDGIAHELAEGDGVAFPAGTGIAHTFLNNTDADVHLLVIGQHEVPGNQVNYPLQPERNADFATRGEYWSDAPKHDLGPHDGRARAGTRKA